MRAAPEDGRVDEPTFFVDRSLGRTKVVAALAAAGVRVERHDDHFPQDAPDTTWLPFVGARGWAVLSKDKRIRHREAERQAVRVAAVALFVFLGGNMTGDEIATTIAKAAPEMLRMLREQRRPFIAGISKLGHVKLIDAC